MSLIAGALMDLALTQENGYYLAQTDGPLDESVNRPFREKLHPLFATKGQKVIVDLSNSKRINSEGLSALVKLVTDANTCGCRVIYASPAPFVAEVFQVTRLGMFFEVAPTRAAAVEAIGG
jgi:anti-anti-sigma factor